MLCPSVNGSGLVDKTQHACHWTIPHSGLAWRTRYSCCFATSSARKQSSMARVGGSVSDSSSFLMWSIFALMTCCCIANAPTRQNRTERKERSHNVFFRVTLTRLGKDSQKAVANPRVFLRSTASTSCDILRKESSVMCGIVQLPSVTFSSVVKSAEHRFLR